MHAQSITAKSIDSKVSFQDVACLSLLAAQDTVDVEILLEKYANGPRAESFIEFWTAFECRATSRNDIKVPPIYNTVNNPTKNEHFPKAIHDYFIEERGDEATWLRMINTPTPQLGFTFLDFIHYQFERNNYKLQETRDAANRMITYVCQHGGVYSKYKDTVKCS